jgi:hypothetical protein
MAFTGHTKSEIERMRQSPKKARAGRFEGIEFVTGEQLNARDQHKREKELLQLKNKNALAMEKERNKGALALENKTQSALSERAALDRKQGSSQFQSGLDLKNRQLQMKKNESLLERLKTLTTDEVDELSGQVTRKGLSPQEALKQMVGEQEALNRNFNTSLTRGMSKATQNRRPDQIIRVGDLFTNRASIGNQQNRNLLDTFQSPRDSGRGSFTRASGREAVSEGLERRPVNSELRKYWNLPI